MESNILSDNGEFLISLLRKNKSIQNPNNPMHQLLKFGVGGFLDYLENFTLTTINKINIFNNNPSDDTQEWEEKITAGLLKLKGDELGIYRVDDETNKEYRDRLFSYIKGNNSKTSIMNIVANLLNISLDSFHITHETINDENYLEFGDTITNMIDDSSTDKLVSLISERIENRSILTIELPSESDIELIYNVISKLLFAGVELRVTNGTETYPTEEGV